MVMFLKRYVWGRLLAVVAALSLTAACGDASTYKVNPDDWNDSVEAGFLWDLEGSVVELARASSRCNQDTSESLLAIVGSQMEFPGEAVTALKSPCAGGAEARIDIDLEGRSILYDFSNVTALGGFPNAEFEGFIFTDMFNSIAAIRGASIDRTASTIDVPDDALSFDEHSVSVNLAGLTFGPASFIKIDLLLGHDLE